MKRIRINAGKIGLIFKSGDYKGVVAEGVYWLIPFEEVVIYDMSKQFFPTIELTILLRDESLAKRLEVIDIKDNEIALQFENGNFKTVLAPGRYAFWKGIMNFSFMKVDLSKIEITEPIDLVSFQRKELIPYIRGFVVEAFEKGILLVDGKFIKVLDTGVYYFWKNPVEIRVIKADMRIQQLEISGQELLTKDKAALRVNFFAQYQVIDIVKALVENKDYDKQLYILMQLALREFVGTLTLDELLDKKESIAQYVLASVKERAEALGVVVKGSGLKDIILPGEVKEIMNQVLIAEKKAQANVIMRREETASARSLLNTARLMEENEMLFKLKEMEYVEKIADKINTISLSGGNKIIDQLRDIFTPVKK